MATDEGTTRAAILKALADIGVAAGAARISARLRATGLELRPRTVRFHLLQMDRDGLTQLVSRRRGRLLTDRGRQELERANVLDRVGFLAARADALGYRMGFQCRAGEGTVVASTALLRRRDLSRALAEIGAVFAGRLGMGDRIAMVDRGGALGGRTAPPGHVILATVCSGTVDGILMGEGIPVTSRFGGLLEMREGKPERFVELMEYSGTTVDPLEIFIAAGLTSVRRCAETGCGAVGASFREIPSTAVDDVRRIHQHMGGCGLSGILAIGAPNQPLLHIPVAEGRTGVIVMGGLNPFAALREAGIQASLQSLAALEDYRSFAAFDALYRRYMDTLRQ